MKTVSSSALISLVFIPLIVLAALGSFEVVGMATLGIGVVLVALATSVIALIQARSSRKSAMTVTYDNSPR